MSPPLVSVVLPTYNQIQYVEQSIRSVVEQDYPNLQVVIGDDGSTDGTIDIILDWAHKYPDRVVPIIDVPHLGITGNCNRILRSCTGKYIAFTAGDDLFLPGKISRQVEWLEADSTRILCGHDVEVFDSSTNKNLYLWSDVHPLRTGLGAHLAVSHVLFCGVANMLRANAVPEYGFDERLSIVSDWKLWIDCLASGGVYGYIEGVYARYRRHGKNITNLETDLQRRTSFADMLTMLGLVETSYPHLIGACRKARAQFFFILGTAYLSEGRNRTAEDYFRGALAQRLAYPEALAGLMIAIMPASVRGSLLVGAKSIWRAIQAKKRTALPLEESDAS